MPHPQLKKAFGDREISLEMFDQYVKKNQKGLFNFKNVAKSDRHMPEITEDAVVKDLGLSGDYLESQKVYQVRNLEDLRKKGGSATNHYPKYENVLAFDGVIDLPLDAFGSATGKQRIVARIQLKMLRRLFKKQRNLLLRQKI